MVRKAGLDHNRTRISLQSLKTVLSLTSRVRWRLPCHSLLACLIVAAWAPFALAESPDSSALLLQSINAVRVEHGLTALQKNPILDITAFTQATYLAKLGELSHLGPNGERLGERLQAAGYDYVETAENLASGPAEAARVTLLWQNSPGHNLNMLHPGYREAGIAIAGSPDGDYWVLILARPGGQ